MFSSRRNAAFSFDFSHAGDYNMTRDITDRLRMFCGRPIKVERLALTMAQVEEYDPPDNPAKQTDGRFEAYEAYEAEYGDQSWELDALDPPVLVQLVRDAVEGIRTEAEWDERTDYEQTGKDLLKSVSGNWDGVQDFLRERGDEDA